jgi:acyl-CoA thioester hydrolase
MATHRARLTIPSESRPTYTLRLRVRQYEIDVLGHVNNAVYLHYLEQVAVEHAERLGFSHARLLEVGGLFVVRRYEIDYLGAATAGDELDVTTWVESISGARAIRSYDIRKVGATKPLVTARAVWAWIDARTFVPRPIPPEMIAMLLPPSPSTDESETSG